MLRHFIINVCIYPGLKSEIFSFDQYFSADFFTHMFLHNLEGSKTKKWPLKPHFLIFSAAHKCTLSMRWARYGYHAPPPPPSIPHLN